MCRKKHVEERTAVKVGAPKPPCSGLSHRLSYERWSDWKTPQTPAPTQTDATCNIPSAFRLRAVWHHLAHPVVAPVAPAAPSSSPRCAAPEPIDGNRLFPSPLWCRRGLAGLHLHVGPVCYAHHHHFGGVVCGVCGVCVCDCDCRPLHLSVIHIFVRCSMS